MNFTYYIHKTKEEEEQNINQKPQDTINDTKIRLKTECGICGNCHLNERPHPLNVYDWLGTTPDNKEKFNLIEVQFKNTRKGYYRNSLQLNLQKGDIVAVESSPGHDIGIVTLTGRLVPVQMIKNNVRKDLEIKRVYRIAKPTDIQKWEEAKSREHGTMLESRQIANDLGLDMKIGDVEYQGDGNKAIFYYIADERVDFRQLIKVLAERFRVRIEMKQIGARQEAGRIGGIGPCGRELCCAKWMSNFTSVSTTAARFQDVSLNPQKLAGQCAKLKCCLNYEVDAYVEARKELPSAQIPLETKESTYYHFKTELFKKQMIYSTDKNIPVNLVTLSTEQVFKIIALNKKGEKPISLTSFDLNEEKRDSGYRDILDDNKLNRFDKKKKRRRPRQNNESARQKNGSARQNNGNARQNNGNARQNNGNARQNNGSPRQNNGNPLQNNETKKKYQNETKKK